MKLTDASIFSRALTTIEIKSIEKYMIKEEKEIVVGRLTSMNGEIIKYLNPKIVASPTSLPSGKKVETEGLESESAYSFVKVAPGITFEELLSELKKFSRVPVLFPLYLKGSVGGFIATNGSGFGSYKFGFVKEKKEVHRLENINEASVMVASYTEIIESDKESKFAWSALIIDGKERYYLPTIYAKLEGINESSIDTYSFIEEVNKIVINSFKRDYIPVMLRLPAYSLPKLDQLKEFEKIIGYIINYNSPEKYYIFLGRIRSENLDDLFKFLKKNKEILPFPSLTNYDKLHLEIMNRVGRKVKTPNQYKNILSIYTDALKCINCSLCLDVCKAYEITRNPFYSPVGKISRLIFEENQFEVCFGCAKDEEVCPVGIQISKLTTEGVNTLSPEKVKIEVSPLPADIQNMEKTLQNMYRNRPLFLLVTGCASKYDVNGIRGFLQYLINNGNSLSPEFSPRVEVVNECCGFDDFVGGNINSAREKVKKILELKANKGAQGIYFLCPEGLYVYNTLSGDKGILAFEVVKKDVKGKIHAGCWAKKLGIKGDDDECAALNFTTYKGYPYPYRKKDVITICPFSTWKFGTTSVYSMFYSEIKVTEKITESEVNLDLDSVLLSTAMESIVEALMSSADEIAEKVGLWNLGGKEYFILISFPIVGNKFRVLFEDKIRENPNKEQIIKYVNAIVNNPSVLEAKTTLISDYIRGQNLSDKLKEVREKILSSNRLEYTAKNLAESEEMIQALQEMIRRAITPKFIERIFNEIAFS